jgi:hypothetical protein
MTTLKLKTNLRCEACVQAIRPLFDAAPGVTRWDADMSSADKVLTVEGDGITVANVDQLLHQKGYQVLGELSTATAPAPATPEAKSSYYPLVLILFYLLGASGLAEVALGGFDWMRAMRHFMAGFFLVFSFFKLLDVPSFAMSYSSYDIVARRWLGYGYLYPFLELGLGAAYLANVSPVATNLATIVVMGVSTVGVLQSVLANRKIQCACLGTVFNLPMSSVTLIEDGLMIGMAIAMLVSIGGG